MADELRNALSDLTPDDVRVDKFGRIVVVNSKIADLIKNAGIDKRLGGLEDNYGCCKNGVACGKLSVLDTM